MATVLLLEDEVNIASFIERGLKENGFMVTIAHDGRKGWEEIENHTFDLLIVDIIIPEINGLDFCQKYRKIYGYSGYHADSITTVNDTLNKYLSLQQQKRLFAEEVPICCQ